MGEGGGEDSRVLTLRKLSFVSLKCFCRQDVVSSQPSPKKIILNWNVSLSVHSLPASFACIMVKIFFTFRDCNVYTFIYFFFFTKRFPVIIVYRIFCFDVFNSSGNEFHSCTSICIPKVIHPCNIPLYEVVLSFYCLIVFCFVLSLRMSLF